MTTNNDVEKAVEVSSSSSKPVIKLCEEHARIFATPHLAFVEKMDIREIEEYQKLLHDSWCIEKELDLIGELSSSRFLSKEEKAMLSNRATEMGNINFEICHKLGLWI